MKTDTIAAIATAVSDSGIGIIRISGDDAIEIADRVYHSKNNRKRLVDTKSHTKHYGYIYDGNELIDEVETAIFNMEAKEISSAVIGELVMDKMKELEPVAYVRFASVYREFKDVNTFIEEIKGIMNK